MKVNTAANGIPMRMPPAAIEIDGVGLGKTRGPVVPPTIIEIAVLPVVRRP
ncbi:hypothetical protein NG798_25540 [Ancylothrix sp. C2]|uniref:hypothetical protein n=1 Tax=Ancylothrix sp. D3o TaxID=2953691 RepID=UPI0021BB8EBD|nr:hypothetical protein [Ancylothrix sp. D3o]MCT7953167.1 hypothetical protein [Ancylothrix sp. D3o]